MKQIFLRISQAWYAVKNPTQCLHILAPYLEMTQNEKMIALAADALYDLKHFREAINAYNQAISLGHVSHHIHVHLAHAYRRLGNLAEAEKNLPLSSQQKWRRYRRHFRIGSCLQERGQYLKAFLIYQTGLC